jgi:hypothetical protein
MTTHDQERNEELERNVRRVFGRLEREQTTSEEARERILQTLLREASDTMAAPSGRKSPGWRRTVRWVGLAAGLLLGVGLLSDALIGSGALRRMAGGDRAPTTATASSAAPRVVTFAIHLLAKGPGVGIAEAATAEGGRPVHIGQERYVSNSDVASARVERADSRCLVSIRLTDDGAGKLARLTRDHVGDQLALVIDGKVVMTPTIRSEITEGLVQLTGDFTDSHCEELARGLSRTP